MSDVMTRAVLMAHDGWSLGELRAFLLEKRISGAPVVDAGGMLVGVVSSTDLMRSADPEPVGAEAPEGAHYYSASLERPLDRDELRGMHVERLPTARVRDIMTPVVFQVDAEASLADVADTMLSGRIHRVIVTRAGKVAGIVTALDVVRAYRDLVRS